MLSDEEAKAIQDSVRTNTHGPLLVRWVEEPLADRRERVEHLKYVRVRVEQAFRYLTTLSEPKTPSQREAKERDRRYRE